VVSASDDPKVDPDKAAAHAFLSELNTRIATQVLPYQYGVEARALESLWELFGHAREALKKYPGCTEFAQAVTTMLNQDLRPVTAKWHRAKEEGILDSRDGADEFRGDLAVVQEKLQEFAKRLEVMAYGSEFPATKQKPVICDTDLKQCLEDLAFGIGENSIPAPPIKGIKQTHAKEEEARKVIAAINCVEAEEVGKRRLLRENERANEEKRKAVAPDSNNAVGLALSGGGIRSATFCLGVAQVLAARGLLRDVDFLSTVSGGGYTGSFLTARLGTNEKLADVAGPYGPDPAPIRYLRYHAKYLTAVDLKDKWSMVTATLAGMILNWSIPVLLVALAALAAHGLARGAQGVDGWPILLGVLSLLTIVAFVLYGALMRCHPTLARFGGELLGWLLAATVLSAVAWLIAAGYDVGHDAVPQWLNAAGQWIKSHWLISSGVGGASVAGPAVLRFIPVLKEPRVRNIVLKVLLWAAVLIIPLGAIALFYGFWSLADQPEHGAEIVIAVAILSALVAFVININLTAPHRLYRDRLAATFIQKDETAPLTISLTGINSGNSAPYHLINTAVNLPSSTAPALRDRKCDFFLFSKHWCGSPIVGYHATKDWKTNGHPPDLATAMAISGAAVSSYMGLGSMPTLTSLLTFLNVRLGFWIRNPAIAFGHGFQNPGFLCLLREMFGLQMAQDKAWLNLSDGGHIENMGVYELLRRRCKYIICVDGEADPGFTFGGLMTLVRHAQIDFGIRIESNLSELKPDPETKFSRVHAVLCLVRYPDEGPGRRKALGLLLYMKLSVTGNEPELIKRYRINHPDFPHQTTLDQFFDEEQFEAYHQLGAHVADGLFSRALMNGETKPPTMAQWFRQLAANLLTPEMIKRALP